MIHPDTELRWIDDEVGYGLVATAAIPRGTITWVLDGLDRVFTPDELAALPGNLPDLLVRFTYADADGNRVLLWDGARHMNHSCAPTCAGTLLGFEIALRDIHPGEQLTNDYVTFGGADEHFPCRCGALNCRGSYALPMTPEQSAALEAAFETALAEVALRPQPLAALVPSGRLERVRASQAAPMLTCKTNQ